MRFARFTNGWCILISRKITFTILYWSTDILMRYNGNLLDMLMLSLLLCLFDTTFQIMVTWRLLIWWFYCLFIATTSTFLVIHSWDDNRLRHYLCVHLLLFFTTLLVTIERIREHWWNSQSLHSSHSRQMDSFLFSLCCLITII